MTLRVTVEIVPDGDESKKYAIHQLDIFNKGKMDFDYYEYGVIELDPKHNTGGMYQSTIFHKRRMGAWWLVQKVLTILVNGDK